MATENKKLNSRLQLKHDTEANWLKAVNFIPLAGEMIIYDADDTNPVRVKIGDGATKVNDLPFYNEKVQDDWLQNDETADDYIKNRTHYEEIGIVNEPFVWEWDGNTDNVDILDINGMSCFKISDIVLTSDMQTEYISRVNYDGYITEDIPLEVDDMGSGVLYLTGFAADDGYFEIVSIPNDNMVVADSFTFPEKGLYVILGTSLYYPCYFATTAPIERQSIIVHKIDPKFLPNVDSGLMRVIITQDDNGYWVADKTYQEISKAILNEKTPYIVIGDRVLYLQQSSIISEISTFEKAPMHVFTSVDSDYYLYYVRIFDNNEIDVADPIYLSSDQYVNEQISAIKDGETLDSFKDVEIALDNLELITVEDIDTICGATIQSASEVMF